ncbi:MAG: aminotransferase class V-fold PLP-dependent enzyme, partial [Cyanobacteria bacterium P01_F01_bin.42]
MSPITNEQLQAQRSHFPALGHNHYFNFGGQGPLPQPALDQMQQTYQHLQRIGPFSNQANLWITAEVEKTRAAIASDLGVKPQTIALTESVSGGCNIAMWGPEWQAGDQLLISDCEHPTVIALAQQLEQRYGVQTVVCPILSTPDDQAMVAAIASAVTSQTRMVVISHVLWNTGQILPLNEIAKACRAQNPDVLIVVDAAQSVGMMPLELGRLDVDAYAFTGHKWCCGPDGLGGLYIPAESLEKFQPTYIGWRAIREDKLGNPTRWQPDCRRFEVATSAFALMVGLQTSQDLHRTFGSPQARYERILELGQQLWKGLSDLPRVTCVRDEPPESGLVSFTIDGADHFQLVSQLEEQGFLLRLIKNPNCIRACVHYLTLS